MRRHGEGGMRSGRGGQNVRERKRSSLRALVSLIADSAGRTRCAELDMATCHPYMAMEKERLARYLPFPQSDPLELLARL